MIRAALVIGGALVLAGPAAAQGLRIAPVEQIIDATDACMDASAAGAVDLARLNAAGWAAGTASDGRGKAIDMPLAVFGKKGVAPILMVGKDSKSGGLCTVTARIASPSDFESVRAALDVRLAARPVEIKADEVTWIAGRELVNLARTGKPDAPGVRVATMQLPEGKK